MPKNALIKVQGTQQFMDRDIPVVEGGFGENQKVVADNTVAEIHNTTPREIRKSINRNIKRFKENVDFIDLKQRGNEITTLEILDKLGYSKQAITQAEHIYLLSERGYAKLIKIMDTDLAWDVHDQLMDEYFHLREEKQQVRKLTPLEELRLQYQVLEIHSKEIESVREEVTGVREEFQDLKDNMPLFNSDAKKIRKAANSVAARVLGGYGSDAYNDNSLRAKVYKDIYDQIHREFGVSTYDDIKRCQFDIAMEIVQNYKAPTVLVTEISNLNNQMRLA